jgi:hypothetical protein
MNELSAFERRLAAGFDELAGPRRAVDAISIARTAASRAAVRRSTLSRFSAVIGLEEQVQGPRLGDLGMGRSARPLLILVAVALIVALALGAVAVGSGLVRLSSVPPPAPPPSRIDNPLPSSTDTTAPGSGSWTLTGKMKVGFERFGETATLLPDGRVLVAGGMPSDSAASASAELYDQASGEWTETGRMHARRRAGYSATLLPDGKVLVAGGDKDELGHPPQSGAELYDPATGIWTKSGSMHLARSHHSATLLPDGKVLVAGGTVVFNDGWHASKQAELYDPITRSWTATGDMKLGRLAPTAALLPDGKVLVVGGADADNPDLQSAELYDPGAGTWASVAPFPGAGACRIATALFDGDVLVVCAETNGVRTSAELYRPATGAWTSTGSPPKECCVGEGEPRGSIVRLADGRVLWKDLVDGGELYDPATGTWAGAGGPTYPADPSWGLPYTVTDEGAGYYGDTLTLLPDGRVLMTTLGAGLLYEPNGGS